VILAAARVGRNGFGICGGVFESGCEDVEGGWGGLQMCFGVWIEWVLWVLALGGRSLGGALLQG